jgi:hypothetical protein
MILKANSTPKRYLKATPNAIACRSYFFRPPEGAERGPRETRRSVVGFADLRRDTPCPTGTPTGAGATASPRLTGAAGTCSPWAPAETPRPLGRGGWLGNYFRHYETQFSRSGAAGWGWFSGFLFQRNSP